MKSIKFIYIITIFLIVNSGIVSACTIFSASNENITLAGNNEDYYFTDGEIRFVPPDVNSYGCCFVGWSRAPNGVEGGMNDQGLFFDCAATNTLDIRESLDKPIFDGNLMIFVLKTCATVEEVITVFNEYNLEFMENYQILYTDAHGNSAIIEGDVVHIKNDYYQVMTNFYLSQNPHPPYPCWRYRTVKDIFESANGVNLDLFKNICDETHQGFPYPTQYSLIYDLNNCLIYIYNYHNFDNTVIFDLFEELKCGFHKYSISDLFQTSQSPETPSKPNGPNSAKIGRINTYSCSANDSDGDQIYYLFDWDDGLDSGWIGPFESGEECSATHIWYESDRYNIKVRVKDVYGTMSEWSDPLVVTMPKRNIIDNWIISNFLNINIDNFGFLDLISTIIEG